MSSEIISFQYDRINAVCSKITKIPKQEVTILNLAEVTSPSLQIKKLFQDQISIFNIINSELFIIDRNNILYKYKEKKQSRNTQNSNAISPKILLGKIKEKAKAIHILLDTVYILYDRLIQVFRQRP